MIEMKGRLEEGDYVRAVYLNMRPRRTYAILGLIVLAAFLWAAWYSFFGGGASKRSMTDYVFVAASVYLILNFFVYVPWKTRKTFKQQKSLQREMKLRFDASGMTVESENSQGKILGADVHKWKENDRLFLLYISDPLYDMVPKRLFASADDIEGVRELLTSHVGAASA